jgi:RHS repeat-associated protein
LQGFNVTYAYDPAGNRLVQNAAGTRTTYQYDAANQLQYATVGLRVTTYQYDAAGNQTLQNAPTGATYYAWDANNRMVSAEPILGLVTYTYDGIGRRVRKQVAGETTQFVYDFEKVLQETDGSGDTEYQYLTTDKQYGDLVSGYGGYGSGNESRYFGFDAQGSTEMLLDDSGSVQDQYQYRAFGLSTLTPGGDYNPFGWVGQLNYRYDTETELYFLGGGNSTGNGGRLLRPTDANFLSKDPVESDANPYRCCGNDPVNGVDPSGNQGKPEDRLRPGSRISNLLVKSEIVKDVTEKLSNALKVTVETVPGPPGSGYTYIVLPPEALNITGYTKIAEALAPYKLSANDEFEEVWRALYRGSINNPRGYSDRYLVVDPLTGKAHVSSAADFGSSEISGNISKVSPKRLKSMVSEGLAQQVGEYIYVAWIDPAKKQVNQTVFEPYRLVEEGGYKFQRSALNSKPLSGDYYKPVGHSFSPLTGGTAEMEAAYSRITTAKAAQTAVDLVNLGKEGRSAAENVALADAATKGLVLVAHITPILGTTIKAIEGDAEEAIVSGIGDLSLLVGVGALDKVRKAGKLGLGWRISVATATGLELGVVVYDVVKGSKDIENEEYWKAAQHFGEAGLRLVGITPGLLALRRSNQYTKIQAAEEARAAEKARAGTAVAPKTAQQLIDTASELGIGIEKLTIEGSVAKVKISYLPSVEEGGFAKVGELLKQQGVKKVIIDSGPVVDEVLAKRLSQLAARGDTYKGAKVRFVKEEESSFIPGKKVPYFEFEYTP